MRKLKEKKRNKKSYLPGFFAGKNNLVLDIVDNLNPGLKNPCY